MLTHPLLLASIKGCYQPKTKSFDDLTNKPPRERKKGKKKKKRKGKPRENQRKKRKGKERKGRGSGRQPRERRERDHGSKEKEEKVTASHPGQPRAAVAAAVVGNAVSRQNRLFVAVLNLALKTFL